MNVIYKILVICIFVFTLPFQVIIGLLVFMFCGFPIFFMQRRIGKDGRSFVMYKFRTMIVNADKLQSKYKSRNISDGPVFKIPNDPRFTRLGKFLSHTGLDELPQIWNVLRGDMAFIGPRPLPESESRKLAPWMRARHKALPGIISPAILSGRYHEDFDAWMRSDVDYVAHKSTRKDMMLACRSVYFLLLLLRAEISRTRSTKGAV
jgi:lipopolysaccharide/colanic/teichoic acid biosynthesis glycosyltransferase